MSIAKEHINIISVPADTASIIRGKHLAPEALLKAGLASKLRSTGLQVTETNALPDGPRIWSPAPIEASGVRNEASNVDVYHRVKETVTSGLTSNASSEDEIPFQIILGGGCDIVPAIMSSYWHHLSPKRVGLIYIDADADLTIPNGLGSVGTLASMTMTHLTMREGALESMRPFTRPDGFGVVDSSNVALFGLNIGLEGNRREQLGYLFDENFQVVTSSAVAQDPVQRAQQALAWLEERVDMIVVHLDVDSIDAGLFPLANVPNFTGATFDVVMQAVRVFMRSEKAAGLVVAEVNPDHDPGSVMTEKLVVEITSCLQGRQ